jgi:serine/threonine-protein kinase
MQVDSILAGKYRLLSQIGRGGMGSVWKAEHLDLCAPVAIKLMDPTLAAGREAAGRFLREAQSAAALRSPHVVQILDYGVDEETQIPFIAMELMEGESLAARLLRVHRLSPAEVARIVTHVARALTRAHEAGIIHRDLKPDNIFLVRNEDEEIAKVLDFGIAKSTAHKLTGYAATLPGSVLGTPYYMSPEQISGSSGLGYQTDLWAVAVIAYECLSGRRPFESSTMGELAIQICTRRPPLASTFAAVPKDFDAWFDRATEREPSRRFVSARELADEFRRVCDTVVVRAAGSNDGARGALSTQSQSDGIQPLSQTTPESPGAPSGRRWPIRVGFAAALIGAAWASTTLLESAKPPAASSDAKTILGSAGVAAISSRASAMGPWANGSAPGAPASSTAASAEVAPPVPTETPTAAVARQAPSATPDPIPAMPTGAVDSSRQAPLRRIDTPRPSRAPSSDRSTAGKSETESKKTAPPASAARPPPGRTDTNDDTGGVLDDRK